MNTLFKFLNSIVLIFTFIPCFSQETAEIKDTYNNRLLFEKYFDQEYYKTAALYIPNLITDEYIDDIVIEKAALTYSMLNELDKCIVFCKDYIKIKPEAASFLYDNIGQCYYYLDSYDQAAYYLGEYVDNKLSQETEIELYILDTYAQSLYETHQYSKAEDYFNWFYNEIADNKTQTLYTYSEQYPYLATSLYKCAYNYFLQGKLNEGLLFLQNSAYCNYEPAQKDLSVFTKSATFNQPLNEIPRKIQKSFEKYSQKFDICKDLTHIGQHTYWNTLKTRNTSLQNLYEKLHQGKDNFNDLPKTLQKAIYEIASGKCALDSHLNGLPFLNEEDLEYTLQYDIFGIQYDPIQIHVYHNRQANAFATPWKQIYLTSELILKYNFNKRLILAACAHEATHSICEHSLMQVWQQEKKKRRNNILAGIAVGLNTVAGVASGWYAASNGVEVSDDHWNSINSANISFVEAFDYNTQMFKFKYSKEQEIEADINAYRFCEATGIGGYAMILALELLGESDGTMSADEKDDHPTLSYRINLLKYLYAHDHPHTITNP